ncbi:hypothetical protein [Pigmentibacter sp. JX0631]
MGEYKGYERFIKDLVKQSDVIGDSAGANIATVVALKAIWKKTKFS